MGGVPTARLTYLFTDVVGSTVLWERAADAMAQAMVRHDDLVGAAVARFEGEVVSARGEGDSRFAVFARAADALLAAAELVRRLAAEAWPTPHPLAVRVAVHTGDAQSQGHSYYGPVVNRAARVRAVGHPNQILVSATAAADAMSLPAELTLRDLGEHLLQDLNEPERVYQLLAPGLDDDFPPLLSLERVRHNLPRQRDELVGREAERAHLAKALEGSRLVTVIGPGGTGKTRLALHVAAEHADDHADGVWLVELAGVSDEATVPAAVAKALGVPLGPGRSPVQAVEDYLRARTALVVLDNCEHLIGGCRDLIGRLLRAAAGLRVLATSRRPLGVRGEQLWPLGPLDYPDPAHLPAIEELPAYDAVALFLARAWATRQSFVLDDETAPAVAEICARLDGIPLAIELATARLRDMDELELERSLGDCFGLLTGGRDDNQTHHRSLRAALDWSWELLERPQQVALRRLSVFAGGFDLDAAEAVAAGDELDREQVVEALFELVDASFVVSAHFPSARYRMLETVRAYADERLAEAGERDATRDCHLSHLADVFAEAERVSHDLLWSRKRGDLLDVELDNARAALVWGLSSARLEGLRLAGFLWPLFWVRGDLDEARRTLEAYLDALPDAPGPLRGRAHCGAGFLHGLLGAKEQARRHDEIALALAEEHRIQEGWVYFTKAAVAQRTGGDEGEEMARRGMEQSIAHGFRGDRFFQVLGKLAEERYDYVSAAQWYERGAANQGPDPSPGRNRILWNLATVSQRLGERERAERVFEEVLAGALELGDAIVEGGARRALGRIALERDDLVVAEEQLRRAVTLARDTGLATALSDALAEIAALEERRGDIAAARRLVSNLVGELRARLHPELARGLVLLGRLQILTGDAAAGQVALEEALEHVRAGDRVCWDCLTEAALATLDIPGDGSAYGRELIAEGARRGVPVATAAMARARPQ